MNGAASTGLSSAQDLVRAVMREPSQALTLYGPNDQPVAVLMSSALYEQMAAKAELGQSSALARGLREVAESRHRKPTRRERRVRAEQRRRREEEERDRQRARRRRTHEAERARKLASKMPARASSYPRLMVGARP